MEASNRRDSVYIEASFHSFYKDLTEGNDAPFRYMKDVFLTAMLIGYRAGQHKPLEKRHMIFKTSAFSLQEDLPILRAVTLVTSSGKVESLDNENGMLTAAEEYANYGFATLRREVLEHPGTAVNNLIAFLCRATEGILEREEIAAAAEQE